MVEREDDDGELGRGQVVNEVIISVGDRAGFAVCEGIPFMRRRPSDMRDLRSMVRANGVWRWSLGRATRLRQNQTRGIEIAGTFESTKHGSVLIKWWP